jgi:ribonucleotide reductase beta subunit family protein with ferritin-like domain
MPLACMVSLAELASWIRAMIRISAFQESVPFYAYRSIVHHTWSETHRFLEYVLRVLPETLKHRTSAFAQDYGRNVMSCSILGCVADDVVLD